MDLNKIKDLAETLGPLRVTCETAHGETSDDFKQPAPFNSPFHLIYLQFLLDNGLTRGVGSWNLPLIYWTQKTFLFSFPSPQ